MSDNDIITGKNIIHIRTLSSKFDNGLFVEVGTDKGETYRVNVWEFLKLLDDSVICEVKQAVKHKYLTFFKETEE